jgi:hypothetical protein
MCKGLAHLGKSRGYKDLNPCHFGAAEVIVFNSGGQLSRIHMIQDLQLSPKRGSGKDIHVGGIAPATPHPDLLETLTGCERDVPVMGMLF